MDSRLKAWNDGEWAFPANSLPAQRMARRDQEVRNYALISPYVAVFAEELTPCSVFLGLDPRIHAGLHRRRAWIPGSRPGMTEGGARLPNCQRRAPSLVL
uniref:Uncharacterized protein n=1 Tax=Rhizobium leguminosarum TaxID=384 RepID=A0A154IIH1_RHILE|nr:hypothetical protein A4A59_21205 [Rhizobium leguminosarum]